ncbi:barstar family protein [Bacillus sp. AFS055030]|uniref:barstar family protein n=1 Tax=Bacillus sp. AFS055030 TaxID=2033507 RepID=UPI000BFCB469|nr:barstar family protein [Bacillus sp. AFS055030]PGL72719.1 hypothetical protein CN925_03110 [Bacillus sp. AFS055030]
MIKNKIYKITTQEISEIKEEMTHDHSLFLVELDGKKIQTWEDYIIEVEKKFKFPRSCEYMWDRYLDWIRDLTWFEEDEYEDNKIEKFALIIYNFNKFSRKNDSLKRKIIDQFNRLILPFWEEEVERVVVEGKAKSFKVYLVE